MDSSEGNALTYTSFRHAEEHTSVSSAAASNSVAPETDALSPSSGRVFERDPSGRFERSNDLLGRGAHKEVFRAYDCENGVEVAWNQLAVGSIYPRTVERILDEISILQTLDCPNIISFYASWATIGSGNSMVVLSSRTDAGSTTRSVHPSLASSSSLPEESKIVFVTELMTSGTLRSFIKKAAGPLRLKVIKNWTRQILTGLEYLHSRNPPIIHRDLKCDNVFINGNNGQAKIGDLGLAIMKKNDRDNVATVIGTPEFMAPELYDEHYDEKVDIYAFGMCVLELVTKEYPYSECENPAQIFRKVTNGVKPAAFGRIADDSLRTFIGDCIQNDPTLRPSASDLLMHPFFAQTAATNDAAIAAVFRPAPAADAALVVRGCTRESEDRSADSAVSVIADPSCGVRLSYVPPALTELRSSSADARCEFISVEVASFKFPVVNLDMHVWSSGSASSSTGAASGHASPLLARCPKTQTSASPAISSPPIQPSPLQRQHIKFPMNIEEEGPEEIVAEMLRLNVIHPAAAPAAISEIHAAIENFLRLYCAAATAVNVSANAKTPLCRSTQPTVEDSGYEPDVEESPSKLHISPRDSLLQWDILRHQLKDNFDSCSTTYATLSRLDADNCSNRAASFSGATSENVVHQESRDHLRPCSVSPADAATIRPLNIQQLAHKELAEFAASAASCSSASSSLNSPSLHTSPFGNNMTLDMISSIGEASVEAQEHAVKSVSTPDLYLIDFDDCTPAALHNTASANASRLEPFAPISTANETASSLPAILDLLALDDIPSPDSVNAAHVPECTMQSQLLSQSKKPLYSQSFTEAAFVQPPAPLIDVSVSMTGTGTGAAALHAKSTDDVLGGIFTPLSRNSTATRPAVEKGPAVTTPPSRRSDALVDV